MTGRSVSLHAWPTSSSSLWPVHGSPLRGFGRLADPWKRPPERRKSDRSAIAHALSIGGSMESRSRRFHQILEEARGCMKPSATLEWRTKERFLGSVLHSERYSQRLVRCSSPSLWPRGTPMTRPLFLSRQLMVQRLCLWAGPSTAGSQELSSRPAATRLTPGLDNTRLFISFTAGAGTKSMSYWSCP